MLQRLEGIQNGPRLSVTTPLEEVETAAATSEVLVLEFEAFRDGRGMSLAAVLRERGYTGRLIAAGKVLPDQARHLRRSGFDAVELAPNADHLAWERMDQVFSGAYQAAIDPTPTIWQRRQQAANDRSLQALADRLNKQVEGQGADAIVRAALDPVLNLKIATVSSFGAESAALLDIVAQENVDVPVLFLETGQHFLQTLSYRTQLTKVLGLSDVRMITPDADEKASLDARDDLWKTDADACCDLRKVRPLARATEGFTALITGRKRYQAATRSDLKPFEVIDGVLRVNPLAAWGSEEVEIHLASRNLPRHPLVDQGYLSIGCWPCTRAVADGEDPRSGRWSGMDKTECGIHLGRRIVAA